MLVSSPLTQETKDTLSKLGPVRYVPILHALEHFLITLDTTGTS